MGRPLKPIDGNLVRKLAARFLSQAEIAVMLGCDQKTISNRFSDEYYFGRNQGKKRLRDKQIATAFRGNVAMLIWLGKQYLGQSEKLDTTISESWEPPPFESFIQDPALLERAMQLERDIADAQSTLSALDAGPAGLPRVAVPPAPPSARGNGNGTAGKPGQESGCG